uniref:Ig-like domain-containing protein n=1 Tax=Strigamia maritima TaxID=126957 RepID=T1JAP1_STRMM
MDLIKITGRDLIKITGRDLIIITGRDLIRITDEIDICFYYIFYIDASSLKLIALNVPAHIETGKSVVLECLYELEGDALYSVKWYKGNYEFYRYLPAYVPPSQIFNLTGVTVDLKNSTSNSVRLENISLSSAGMYKCEVSTETPFHTEEAEKQMDVYAAYLEWHVNGDKASKEILHKYPDIVDDDKLETSILGLDFKVEERHFSEGELTLKCTASINYIYQESNEQAIMADHLQASLLESQRQPKPGKSCHVKPTGGVMRASAENMMLWLLVALIHSISVFHR